MQQNIVETITGGLVLVAAAAFLLFAINRTQDASGAQTYTLKAEFAKVGELAVGSDVRVSGIKVGSVTALTLDRSTYKAVVTLSVASDVVLPLDSGARIESAGLLGGNFLSIQPGADLDVLANGDQFEYTQGALSLMDLISKALFAASDNEN